MRKTRVLLVVALTLLLTVVPMPPAGAETGKLKLTIPNDNSGTPTVRAGDEYHFWGRMLDANDKTRCKNARGKELQIVSDAFSESPDYEWTNSVFKEYYTIKAGSGTVEVRALCRGWVFIGHVRYPSRALPHTGVPALPLAGLGLGLIAVGWLLRWISLRGARDRFGGGAAG